jgi:hypothetical protein
MKPVNLFGSGLKANSLIVASENRLNCFYDVRKDTGEVTVRGTPGSILKLQLPTFPVRGMRTVGNVLYAVAGANLYSVDLAGNITRRGGLGTSSGRVGVSDNFTQLIVVDGAAGWVYNILTPAWAQITDVNFPNGATTVAFLSGRFICENPSSRSFYVSNALDGLTWTTFGASVFANKEQYSDLLSAVDSFNGNLILWGTGSIEYWQDVGASPNPFQKVIGATQTIGLYGKYSRAIIDNSQYFLGTGVQGGLAVFAVTSYQPIPVSTPDVDDLINKLVADGVTMADAVGMGFNADGHDFYQITFPTANLTLAYDVTAGLWLRMQTGTQQGRHYADTAVVFNSQTVFCDSTSQNLYSMVVNAYSDNGNPIVRQVATKHIRNGGDEFSITELDILMDTGMVPVSSNCQIMLEVSRNSGRTFGSPRPRTIGLIGQYKSPRVKWDRMGSAIDFVLRFTMTDPIPFVIAGAEIETSTGD